MTITKEILLADRDKARDEIAFHAGRLKQLDALIAYLDLPEPTQPPTPDAST